MLHPRSRGSARQHSAFYEQLQQQAPVLQGLQYLAVGLGDTSYDTFATPFKSWINS
ncbi:hypothetical protein MBH78_06835 [Oceanimonas sp. NS1]|nr:hypothetical protein [Oceanimonas sp. NS1]